MIIPFRKGQKRQQVVGAFTLIELLLVISIIALLASLLFPVFSRATESALSTKCAGNLRQIGVAVHLAAADNENKFPAIETDPTAGEPVYPPEANVKGLLETLRPYGLSEKNVQCPADLQQKNYYAQKGSSYEWRPMLDGESKVNPTLFMRFGAIEVPLSRARLCMDFDAVHSGRMNLLYADGHVRSF